MILVILVMLMILVTLLVLVNNDCLELTATDINCLKYSVTDTDSVISGSKSVYCILVLAACQWNTLWVV